jgi:hypothetical protein
VRFIFSHSALREGWDNPNVFQICTLKHGGISPTQKRQEVGRGLRRVWNQSVIGWTLKDMGIRFIPSIPLRLLPVRIPDFCSRLQTGSKKPYTIVLQKRPQNTSPARPFWWEKSRWCWMRFRPRPFIDI